MNDITLIEEQLRSWKTGIGVEQRFWSLWFETRGLEWPHEFDARMAPDRPFDDLLESLLTDNIYPAHVLDVGSGPVSGLGKIPKRRAGVILTAVDPLSSFYHSLAKKYGYEIQVQPAFAEFLTSFFSLSQFEIVHCSNALDHSFDPLRSIREMAAVTKSGGHVVLRHAENEAENEKYRGFHQWNITENNDHMIIWNKKEEINVSIELSDLLNISVKREPSGGILAIARRTGFPVTRPDAHLRLRALLCALVNVLSPNPEDGAVTD